MPEIYISTPSGAMRIWIDEGDEDETSIIIRR